MLLAALELDRRAGACQALLDEQHLLLVLLGQVLGQTLGRELCLTNVPEIFGQVQGLVLDQRREQGHVGRLSPSGRQVQADLLELFAQLPAAVLALGAPQDAAQQRRVQALGRREAPLDLAHGHLVLRRRREQRQSAGHRAEGVGRASARQRQQVGAREGARAGVLTVMVVVAVAVMMVAVVVAVGARVHLVVRMVSGARVLGRLVVGARVVLRGRGHSVQTVVSRGRGGHHLLLGSLDTCGRVVRHRACVCHMLLLVDLLAKVLLLLVILLLLSLLLLLLLLELLVLLLLMVLLLLLLLLSLLLLSLLLLCLLLLLLLLCLLLLLLLLLVQIRRTLGARAGRHRRSLGRRRLAMQTARVATCGHHNRHLHRDVGRMLVVMVVVVVVWMVRVLVVVRVGVVRMVVILVRPVDHHRGGRSQGAGQTVRNHSKLLLGYLQPYACFPHCT